MQALKLLGQQLAKIWNQLGINQKVVIVASGLVVLAGLSALILWSSRTEFGLLYGKLSQEEAGTIVQVLDENKIPYEVKGQSIYVPRDKVSQTRMTLATKGLPKNQGVGFEIFDKPTFGMSDRMQEANYIRAVQGELARTIGEIEGIESARVMIVKPENRLLVDPSKKHTASVFLKVRGMFQVNQTTVNAIRFLVANSVEGLKPNNVSVMDNSGNLLSENSEDGSLGSLTSTQLGVRREVEKYLAGKVQTMLEKVVGPDKVVVTVAAEINTDSITKSDEVYSNPGAITKTETVRDESSNSLTPNPGGVPGVTPNANTDTNNPAYSSINNQVVKKDSTKEFALSMSKTNIVQMPGGLKRVTASVLIDTNGNTSLNVTNIKSVVINALGLPRNPDNPDGTTEVEVFGVSFSKDHEIQLTQELDQQRRQELLWTSGKSLLYVLLGLAALFGFWRLVKNSTEELLPTGIPVGQLIGGQLVYETPVGQPGMPLPSGAMQTMEEQKVEDIVAQDEDVEELQAAKSKLVMDFGLGQQAPERITIEVLKQLIRENPAKMSQAARIWMSKRADEGEE